LTKIPGSQIVDVCDLAVMTAESSNKGKKRVLSGIRATGRLHLGNYLGAVKGFLELQNSNEYETLYMVADVHTITTPYNIDELRKNRREVIIDYLAAGLDPKKSIIFQQAEVNEHIELAFLFSSVVTIARMQHLPTFKEKVKQYPQNATMALLNYPILMASDILVYKAGLVPVGIDQEPHLEVTREIARKMNQMYGTDFPEPVRFATKGEYIPSLTGEGKMAKTIEGSYITLTDSKEEIRKKIRSVPTATHSGGAMTPGVKTLFTFAKLFTPNEVAGFEKSYQDQSLQFVSLKDAIAEAIYKELEPFQKRRAEISKNQKYIDEVISDGAERARKIARETVQEVKEKMGLL
jgi:tryptophanyl-tRNA synthetase